MIGMRRLQPTRTSAANGVLRSTWKLPARFGAKTMRLTLTVTTEGVTVTKTHLHPVR